MHYPNLTFHGGEAIRHVWWAARKQNPENSPSRTCFGNLINFFTRVKP